MVIKAVLALAGLAAAQQLRAFGYQVVVLEGQSRPGGRVYTKKLKVLVGKDANPTSMHPLFLGSRSDIP